MEIPGGSCSVAPRSRAMLRRSSSGGVSSMPVIAGLPVSIFCLVLEDTVLLSIMCFMIGIKI